MDLEQEILELKQEQKNLCNSQREQNKILLRIESVIISDEETGRKGIGQRVNDLESNVKEINRFKWILMGFVLAAQTFLNWLMK